MRSLLLLVYSPMNVTIRMDTDTNVLYVWFVVVVVLVFFVVVVVVVVVVLVI